MIRFALVAAVLALASPAFAATDPNCTAFVEAFKGAGKTATGKDLKEKDVTFWKKMCLKQGDEDVKKKTACLGKVKTEKELLVCIK